MSQGGAGGVGGGSGGSGGTAGAGGTGGSGGEEEVGDPAFVAFRFDHPERYGEIQFFTRGGQEVEAFDGMGSGCEGSDDAKILFLPSGVRHLEIHSERGLRWRGNWLVETDSCQKHSITISESYTYIHAFGVGGRLVPLQIWDEAGNHIDTLVNAYSEEMLADKLGPSDDEVSIDEKERIALLELQESGHLFLAMVNEDTSFIFEGIGREDSFKWATWYPVPWNEWMVEFLEVE